MPVKETYVGVPSTDSEVRQHDTGSHHAAGEDVPCEAMLEHPLAEARMAQLEERIASLHAAMDAAVAEAARARQRARADLEHARKFAIEDLAKALLPFKDALDTALAVDTSDVSALKTGLELSLRQLRSALEKHGVSEISPAPGDTFDPQKHRPLVMRNGKADMSLVAHTEQKGYAINGRVIRPAFVVLRQ